MEDGRIIESWKEISVYLNRSEKTCRRWEGTLGLPVHRLDGTPRARVFAYPAELDRWLAEKLHHAEGSENRIELSRRTARIRPWWLILAGAMVVFAALALLVRPGIFSRPAPVPLNNPVLVVLPFDNPTGDAALESWRTALPNLLTADLRQSRYVNTMPVLGLRATLDVLKLTWEKGLSSEDLARIAERAGADFTATGSLIRAGEDIVVNVSLQNAKTKAAARALRTEVLGEQGLMDKADDLTREIKRALGLTSRQMARDIDDPVRRIATGSAQALLSYDKAVWSPTFDPFPDMVPALEKAIDLDPGFGLAHVLLYTVYHSTHLAEMLQSYRKALELSDRMSERDRLNLQADFYHYYHVQGGQKKLADSGIPPSILAEVGPKDTGPALDVLERLMSLYPDAFGDGGKLIDLATIYTETEEWTKAIAVLERGMTTPQGKRMMSQRLFNCYRAAGVWEKAETFLEDQSRQNPNALYDIWRRDLAMDRGRYDEALEYAKKVSQLRTKGALPYAYFSEVGYVLWLKDDLSGAEQAHRTVVDPANPYDERQRSVDLAALSLSRGKAGQALDFIKRGLELAGSFKQPADPEMERALHWELASLERLSGRPQEALKEAEEACRDYDNPRVPPAAAAMFLHLRALINLELDRRDDFERQAEEIKAFSERERYPKLMRAYYHLLGLKELRQNQAQKAIQHFQKALDLFTPSKRDPVRVMCLFSLAEAHQRLGEGTFAIPCYDQITQPGTKESWTGDLYAKSFYRKAREFEERWRQLSSDSLKALAVENYAKFLDLWKDADPIFPEVEDAKTRLARLEVK